MDVCYTTITGRQIDLSNLAIDTRGLLREVFIQFSRKPTWAEFSSWCRELFSQRGRIINQKAVEEIAEDLAGRLGIAQRQMALPGPAGLLLEEIQRSFTTRENFCNTFSINPQELGAVVACRDDLPLGLLKKFSAHLGLVLWLRPLSEIEAQATLDDERNMDLLRRVSESV